MKFHPTVQVTRVFLLLLLASALSGCATNPVTGESDFVLMSEEQEIAMGKANDKQVLKQYRVYENPELQSYVEELGQKLAASSHRSHLAYKFTLLDSPEVNAFALPGGYVYVTRGIMAYMNSEEELAGVLGHEIGHVTARHSVRQHGAQTAAGVIGLIATLATGSQAVADASNQLGSALVRGYGRSHELEADRLGAEYLARTDYDPQKMLDVVGILKNQEEFELQRAREEGRQPRVYHGVFSTHPENDERLQEVVRAADQFANPDPVVTDTEAFLRLMEGVTFGDSEDQGIVRGTRFYHKPLNITLGFPEGWRIENQPQQLVGVRSDGEAAILVKLDTLKGSENPAQYLHRNFQGLQSGEKITGGGYTGVTTGNTPYGNRSYRVSSTPYQDNKVFLLLGFSRSGRPDQVLLDTTLSIRALEPGEVALATAQRISLVRAKSGDTFSKLAQQTSLGKYAEERLRLLNGMYPDGEPVPGQLIKTID
jgi:predicted Zn-dependent protease